VRAVFEGFKAYGIVLDSLRGREKKGRRNFSGWIAVFRILGDANDFKVSRVLPVEISEVFSDGIFIFEKLLRKGLVYDGDVASGGRVLFGDCAAFENLGADGFEVAVANAQPGGFVLTTSGWRRSLPFDKSVLAPVVSL